MLIGIVQEGLHNSQAPGYLGSCILCGVPNIFSIIIADFSIHRKNVYQVTWAEHLVPDD